MIPIAFEEIEALGLGELQGYGEITGLEIDSRRVGPGDLFVAIRGGREFVGAARDRGAATLVPNDEFDAMAVLGQALRGRSRARFVGVTGSTGKTSTKDILAALCANVAPTVWTEGSYTAELGVPLTLGRLEPETELCIVEMGMRGLGQIADLCEIVRPHVGLISAVGPVHLELVGSVEGVARSKAELVAALPPDGIAVVPESSELEPHLRSDIEILRVPPVDVELREDGAHVAFGERRIRFPLTSRHQAQNALAAMTAYEAMDLPLDRLEEGAARVQLSKWRGEELPLPGGGFVVNDAYNANPTSMRAALVDLAERAGGRRRVAILGEMAELGQESGRYHDEIRSLLRELGVEVVIAVGEPARAYLDEHAEGAAVADAAAFADVVDVLEPGDAILVKASRAVGLEGIPALIEKHSRAW